MFMEEILEGLFSKRKREIDNEDSYGEIKAAERDFETFKLMWNNPKTLDDTDFILFTGICHNIYKLNNSDIIKHCSRKIHNFFSMKPNYVDNVDNVVKRMGVSSIEDIHIYNAYDDGYYVFVKNGKSFYDIYFDQGKDIVSTTSITGDFIDYTFDKGDHYINRLKELSKEYKLKI